MYVPEILVLFFCEQLLEPKDVSSAQVTPYHVTPVYSPGVHVTLSIFSSRAEIFTEEISCAADNKNDVRWQQ